MSDERKCIEHCWCVEEEIHGKPHLKCHNCGTSRLKPFESTPFITTFTTHFCSICCCGCYHRPLGTWNIFCACQCHTWTITINNSATTNSSIDLNGVPLQSTYANRIMI